YKAKLSQVRSESSLGYFLSLFPHQWYQELSQVSQCPLFGTFWLYSLIRVSGTKS
ncbi:hypothetical protein OS493_026995, partial [Desmophyllum pertusum]